jgi:hypothetical protein
MLHVLVCLAEERQDCWVDFLGIFILHQLGRPISISLCGPLLLLQLLCSPGLWLFFCLGLLNNTLQLVAPGMHLCVLPLPAQRGQCLLQLHTLDASVE